MNERLKPREMTRHRFDLLVVLERVHQFSDVHGPAFVPVAQRKELRHVVLVGAFAAHRKELLKVEISRPVGVELCGKPSLESALFLLFLADPRHLGVLVCVFAALSIIERLLLFALDG